MANRAYRNQGFCADSGVVEIQGGFVTNGGSNPTVFLGPWGLAATGGPSGVANLPNGISAITHSGTGAYTLTFVDNFFCVLYQGVNLAMGTAANSFAQFTGFTNLNTTSTLTAVITTLTAGSAADIAAGSNTNIVSFHFKFKNSFGA
jgi:hypothetical protein